MLPEQVKQWAESPVNKALISFVDKQIDELENAKGLDCYHIGEPQRTQEALAAVSGSLETWDIIRSLLEGDWAFFEEEDE